MALARPMALHPARWRALAAAGLAALILASTLDHVSSRYRLVYDGQVTRCLEVWLFLVDLHDREIARGGFVAFRPPATIAEHYGRPVAFLKRIVGLPGDRVTVGQVQTTVNGREVGKGLALATRLEVDAQDLVRSFIVPESAVFLMGDTADSYDGRYWGALPASEIIGEARWLL
ncbi:MAG: signal peptidase I [Pseudomonadota bacterium]